MNLQFIEQLLNEDESSSLDFKSTQYPFGPNDDRSEIVKDILALANSWRDRPAHILIGVEEVVGGRSSIVGITQHIPEHTLQQFIAARVNRLLHFSYEVVVIEGKQIGVICIPVQKRPFFLKKDFGKLKAHEVRYRLGSATAIATPEEIAAMGAHDSGSIPSSPHLTVRFGLLEFLRPVGTNVVVPTDFISYDLNRIHEVTTFRFPATDSEFPQELAEYIHVSENLKLLAFIVENTSPTPALDVLVELSIDARYPVRVMNINDFPDEPVKIKGFFGCGAQRPGLPKTVEVRRHPSGWKVINEFGGLRPGTYKWSNSSFLIGASQSCHVNVQAHVAASNLPKPIDQSLSIDFKVTEREIDYDLFRSWP